MARIRPDGWEALDASQLAAVRTIATLRALRGGLPDDYTVYHGIDWAHGESGLAAFGRIDFIVVNAAGDLLLIELVPGLLRETADGLVKRVSGRETVLATDLARARRQVLERLGQRADIGPVKVDLLLFCPNHHVRQPASAGLMPERIVDAPQRDQLARRIAAVLPPGEPAPASHSGLCIGC